MGFSTEVAGQIIHATDITQFSDFLTGAKQDVAMLLVSLVKVKSRGAAPGALSAALAAGGSIDVGAHDYAVTFVDDNGGETIAGTHTTLTTTSGNQTGNLTAIPTGPTGTAKRNIYRSKVGTTTPLYLLHTINDNTTTTYSDTATDASLPTTTSPVHPSFGGSTAWQDNTGAVKAQVFSDGAAWFASTLSVGTGVNGDYSGVRESGTAGVLVLRSSMSGGASLGVVFATYNGSAQVQSFSVGGQFSSALSWVDNSGHFFDNGKNVPFINPTGASTAGRQIFTGTTTPTGANEGDIWIKA